MIQDYFAVAVAAQRRAAERHIVLLPIPNKESEVHLELPSGHYLRLWDRYANVVIVDSYDGADIYHDLIPGYHMMGTFLLPIVNRDGSLSKKKMRERSVISVTYAKKPLEKCGQCNGTGKILNYPMSFDGDSDRLIPDIGCVYYEPCDECGGTGLWEVDS